MDLISLKKLFLTTFFHLRKGSYTCICHADFVGDGVSCMPEPEKPTDLKITVNPLLSGWNLIRKNLVENETGTIIILISLFWFMGSAYFTLIPIYGKELLDATATNVSLLTLALAIGVGIGSFICEKISRETIDLGLVSISIILILIISIEVYFLGEISSTTQQCNAFPFFLGQCFDRFFFDMIVMGIAGALYVIPLYAALQNRINKTHCNFECDC